MLTELFGRKDVRLGLVAFSGALFAIPVYRYVSRLLFERNYPWVEIGKVDTLYVYPVKSFKGNKVETMQCGKLGASAGEEFDRYFLVVDDETNHFYTARQIPTMVLLEAHVKNDILKLRDPEGREIEIDLDFVVESEHKRTATLHFKLRQEGLDCGDHVAAFLTEALGLADKPCRLLYFQEGLFSERQCVPSQNWWNHPVPKRVDDTAFVDLAPYLAFSSASVDHLNKRLYAADPEHPPVSERNFRPNIVVTGMPPYDEDRWLELRIGDVEFACYKPCTRCILTTIDPFTGKRSPCIQPLKLLRDYRLAPEGKLRKEFGQSPIFGVNMGIIKQGTINAGDPVFARYKPEAF